MTDEEYVRARWQLVAAVPTVVNGYVVCAGLSADRQTVLRLWMGPLHQCTEAEAWSIARTFTENREREIAEVQEEIAELESHILCYGNGSVEDERMICGARTTGHGDVANRSHLWT